MRFRHFARVNVISSIIAIVTFSGIGATPAMAQRVVLDFEGLKGMTFWSRSPIPPESRLSDAFLRTYGVQFSSGNSYVAVVENGIDHAVSGKNGIGGATSNNMLTYDSQIPVVARFFDPANPAIAGVTDFVSARGDLWGSGLPVTLKAFDVNGNLLTEASTSDSGGETLVVSSPGIHSIEFHGTIDDAGVALDDFTFNRVRSTGVNAAATPRRIVLDFEGFGAMTFISRSAIPPSARLSDAFLLTDGVRFSSGSPFVAVTENGAGMPLAARMESEVPLRTASSVMIVPIRSWRVSLIRKILPCLRSRTTCRFVEIYGAAAKQSFLMPMISTGRGLDLPP